MTNIQYKLIQKPLTSASIGLVGAAAVGRENNYCRSWLLCPSRLSATLEHKL
jgi:hypothetical protein